MAQTAGLARFIEQHLRPGQVDVDPEVLRRLRALADNPDMDVQAIALMALQVGYGEVAGVKETIDTRLNRLPEDGALRRRWAIASDQLGEAFGAKGDVASATACFEKALVVQPRNEVLLSHLALAQFRSGHGQLAIDTLKRAIALRPAKAVLHFQLAQLFSQLQRLPEAAAALEAGLQYSPDDANARAMLQKLRGQ
jgi:tetratricopeptide (TPR) repeat protein